MWEALFSVWGHSSDYGQVPTSVELILRWERWTVGKYINQDVRNARKKNEARKKKQWKKKKQTCSHQGIWWGGSLRKWCEIASFVGWRATEFFLCLMTLQTTVFVRTCWGLWKKKRWLVLMYHGEDNTANIPLAPLPPPDYPPTPTSSPHFSLPCIQAGPGDESSPVRQEREGRWSWVKALKKW